MGIVGETARRRILKLASPIVVGSLALTACGESSPLTEPIDLNHPVPTTETVAPSLLPDSEATTAPNRTYGPATTAATATIEALPGPDANLRKSTMMLVCLGGFADKLSGTFTVDPISQYLHDPSRPAGTPLVPFPMITSLQGGGNSRIEPAQPYEQRDRAWFDLQGTDMRTGGPPCEERPVREATITVAGVGGVNTRLALVGPDIVDKQVVDLSTPGAVEHAHQVYDIQFDNVNGDEQILAAARSLQGAS